ncbi:MAG: RNA polymerase sigma factor [Nitrospinae bacterium]|nr:RNA polymerase sigma factor [Nitrospinota bacterium]
MADHADEKFRRHFEPLFGQMLASAWRLTGSKEDAEDLIQETFLKAYRHADRFDPAQSAGAWLFTIMKNTFLNNLRGRREVVPFDAALMERLADEGADRPGDYEGDWLGVMLNALPPDMRAILVAREVNGLSYEQIAQAMEIPSGTVKSRISRAREALKELWLKNAGELGA